MRRTTAATLGTLAGAAMLIGARMAVATPDGATADVVAEEPLSPDVAAGGTGGGEAVKYTGDPVENDFGTVQVTITMADGKITAVSAKYPNTGNSKTVNGDAVPKLRAAVLEAQSAELDTVSGATSTSESFKESLESALEKAEADAKNDDAGAEDEKAEDEKADDEKADNDDERADEDNADDERSSDDSQTDSEY